ncbi:hypothetical protein [Massilia sp. HP4]|uniref:hypothetical protein n=1 Tax=Massilia sp. HP4 TaxID=2562316 RepID=UPI0014859678|nr:hypothetical protein [Massilia sp. HP4]
MHAHLRPNLMSSSRRAGHEDSILAKLEREPARRKGVGNGPRLAWYGTAAMVALGLTATLAWLAAGTGPAPLAMARSDDAPPAAASAPPAPLETALIVDAAPEAAVAPPPAPVLPLRLLEPAPVQVDPAKVTPPVAKAAPPRRVEPRAAPPARARAQAARPAPRQATRTARTVNPARAGETPDDSDVALISAVIYHANGHAAPDDVEAPAACGDESCRVRPSR